MQTAAVRSYEQDDVFRSRHVVDGALSPDRSFAIYQLSEMVPGKTKDEDKQLSSLWQIDLAGGKPRRLTAKGKNASSVQMAPDGESVYFFSARDAEGKVGQIYRLPLGGGEAEQITSLDQGVAAFALSPNGEWIAFAALEKLPKTPGPNDHVRINKIAHRFDAVPGYLKDVAQAIYLIPSRGGEAKALTPHDGAIGAMVWSPDSREIAATIMGRRASRAVFAALGDLCVVDRDGHERLLLESVIIGGLFWTADGQRIGYTSPPDGNSSRQSQLFLIDRTGGNIEARTPSIDRAVGGAIGGHNPAILSPSRLKLTPDGASVLAVVGSGGENPIYKIALSGPESYQAILSGERACKILDRVGTALLFSAQDCNTAPELRTLDLATGQERKVTDHNAEWHAQVAWPKVEHITVKNPSGVEIEGWVLVPSVGSPPFKTLLDIHGGPHGAYGYTFNEDFQELVGAGYAVAFANPRGSIGYGDAFSSAIIGRWGHTEEEDLMAFLDEVVKRGIADPNRLGVTGLSYGGYMTGWLLGHTDRFKAAIPEEGNYNMISAYGVSDAGIELRTAEFCGPPHEQLQRYWDSSPLAHAHKCTTPTLLIQGENDLRCPMEEAEQLYAVLKTNGCTAEFLRLKNCNHGLEIYGPPPLRRFRMDAIKDWFARYIT